MKTLKTHFEALFSFHRGLLTSDLHRLRRCIHEDASATERTKRDFIQKSRGAAWGCRELPSFSLQFRYQNGSHHPGLPSCYHRCARAASSNLFSWGCYFQFAALFYSSSSLGRNAFESSKNLRSNARSASSTVSNGSSARLWTGSTDSQTRDISWFIVCKFQGSSFPLLYTHFVFPSHRSKADSANCLGESVLAAPVPVF